MTALVIAPHADDETLGCGGTMLKLIASRTPVHWMIVTDMIPELFSPERFARREQEIDQVAKDYGVDSVIRCKLPTTKLDTLPIADMVSAIAPHVKEIAPATLFLPYAGDAHSDHAAVFKAASACTKTFRFKSVRRVLIYETLSETDFGVDPDVSNFRPNSFSDVSDFIDRKIAILRHYAGEMGEHPFPRSESSIRSLATLRGTVAGVRYAEAFMTIKELW